MSDDTKKIIAQLLFRLSIKAIQLIAFKIHGPRFKILTHTVTLLNKSGKEVQKLDIQNENRRFTKEPVYLIDVTFDGYADLLIPFQRTAAAHQYSALPAVLGYGITSLIF